MSLSRLFFWSVFSMAGIGANSHVIAGEMITIPSGEFIMGNNKGDWDQKPFHTIYLPEYQIGKYKVTRGEFCRFMEAGGYNNQRYWSDAPWKWKEGNSIIYAGMCGKVDPLPVGRITNASMILKPHRHVQFLSNGVGHSALCRIVIRKIVMP